ncbi:MAG: SufS family cysteine desulfurase [Candidatus Sungiibacteriota bacterium]
MALGKNIRKDFPIYGNSKDPAGLCYLDSGATSLKPAAVIDALRGYYEEYSTNVHRAAYPLAERATQEYEDARSAISAFIGASRPEEIVFTRNTTEAFNLIAASYAGHFLKEGEGILLSEMEHHANLIPWHTLARTKNLRLFFLPFSAETGELEWDADNFVKFLKERKIKLVSLTQVSNVLGTINPIAAIAAKVHEAGAIVVVDGAQSAPHISVDVQKLGADFFTFSGHKMLGPTGIGVLYGRYDLLEKMPPYQTGSDMIQDVYLDRSTFRAPPLRFEAGTPHIAGTIGLGGAVKYLSDLGMERVREHEKMLLDFGIKKLSAISGMRILGTRDVEKRSGALAFVVEGMHPHDVGSFCADLGVLIRVGDHCARPLHQKLKIPASCRMSISVYNDTDDVERLVEVLRKMIKVFKIQA